MAWIYHNATLWLISLSSDWENWITIADKNLWATSTDTSSTDSYWYYYQWGNNYWFPTTWSVTTSSSQVNVSTYWPNNYYSSSTFITSDTWDSSNNANLWGDTTNTSVARKWPCDTWYHIASLSEMQSLIDLWIAMWAWTSTGISAISSKILLPLWWSRSATSWSAYEQWTMAYYWTSTPTNSSGSEYTRAIVLDSIFSWSVGTIWKCYWWMIRPFKNEAVIPDYNDVWDTLYWDELPDRPAPVPVKKLKWLMNKWNFYYFDEAPTHASSVTLNESSITLTEAWQTEQLTATVSPDDAVEKKVHWSSSDITIATVDQTGLVTCVTPGSCTITASCDWVSATCDIINIVNWFINYIVIWWWGWWVGNNSNHFLNSGSWAWWWWEVVYNSWVEVSSIYQYSITIWCWWSWWYDAYSACWWQDTILELNSNCIVAKWWCHWWWYYNYACYQYSWWDSWSWCQWYKSTCEYAKWMAWWWWGAWWNANNCIWWIWICWYWWWGWGWQWTTYWWWNWNDWWWNWWTAGTNWCNWTNYWWWGWWAWYRSSWWWNLKWWDWAWWAVIICYKTDGSDWITCATWWTVTTSWDYTIHTFTSDWTFCIIS